MDIQPLQTAMNRLAWAPLIGVVIGLAVMTLLICLKVWLRHKFPPAPTRIEIVQVSRESKEANTPTNETGLPKSKTADDSRYMPKAG